MSHRSGLAPGLVVVALALGLAALSLLVPAAPGYDQWSWLSWGQQLVHGHLDLAHASSWKPLPVVFTTPFALLGGAAPDVWLVFARTAGVLALVQAFRVTRRLAGGGGPGALGGAVAVAGLVLADHSFGVVATGASETLVVLLALTAVERHLAGQGRLAFACAWAVGLLRPEVWPLLAGYGVWLVRRDRRSWRLVAVLAAALLVAWYVPPWATGDILAASHRARVPSSPSYRSLPHPIAHALDDLVGELPVPVLGAALMTLAAAAWAAWRRGRLGPELVLGGVAAVWAAIAVGMILAGYAGSPRYFLGATALGAVVAGAGTGWAARRLPRPWTAAVAGVAAAGLAVAAVVRVPGLGVEARRMAAWGDAVAGLPRVVADAGGAARVLRCGIPGTPSFTLTMVAVTLDVPPSRLAHEVAPGGTIIQQPAPGGGWEPATPPGARVLAVDGHWRIAATACPPMART